VVCGVVSLAAPAGDDAPGGGRLAEFVGDAPQYDDVTILALRWLSSPG